jgi:hypothetical protein
MGCVASAASIMLARARQAVAEYWDSMHDVSKIMLLVVGGWVTPKWFELYEYFVWSLREDTRDTLEMYTYLGFFAAIFVTVQSSLARARVEGYNEAIDARQTTSPPPKSN